MEVEFIGGPQDGRVEEMPYYYDKYYFPVPVPVTWTYEKDTGTLPETISKFPAAVYKQAYYHGGISRNDKGQFRFIYTGIRDDY
jgi:hypothetical protein